MSSGVISRTDADAPQTQIIDPGVPQAQVIAPGPWPEATPISKPPKIKQRWRQRLKLSGNDTLFGYPLKNAVMAICFATMGMSIVTLIAAVINLSLKNSSSINTTPLVAVNLIFSIVAISLSVHQILLSGCLVWLINKVKSHAFLCSVWYTTHFSIIVAYAMLYLVRFIVCLMGRLFVLAAVTMCICVIHQGIFAYFCAIVNAYMKTLNEERYY